MTRSIKRHIPDHVVPRGWWTPELQSALEAIPTSVWRESVLSERDTLNCLRHFKPVDTRVVIVGQDPYPSPGKANGLAFGVRDDWVGDRLRSSSGNVAREASMIGAVRSGYDFTLESWAKQGVLLLNCDLSVAEGKPGSHRGVWREVVRCILNQLPVGVVYAGFGARGAKLAYAERGVLSPCVGGVTHPCRYSAEQGTATLGAFVGSDIFGRISRALAEAGRPPVKWTQHEL